MHWMEACLGISESEFRNFDAMRQASQCIGRVLRNKTDYGMMVLVDRRFALNDKRQKLPAWILQCLQDNTNLSVDAAVAVGRRFFKEMAQPWDQEKDLGTTLLSHASLLERGLCSPQKAMFEYVTGNTVGTDASERPHIDEPLRPNAEPARKRRREEAQLS
jgi:DNA excision repair protein ERCC-2